MLVRRMGRIPAHVVTVRNPIVRRRELGALLRELRTEAGLTVEEVAGDLLCSASKVSRMETGQRAVSLRDVRDLCALYNVTDQTQRDHLNQLAKDGRGQAWWQPYDLPHATLVGLEAEATRISDYDPGVAPGLLQTPEYARAIHHNSYAPLNDSKIEQRIQVLHNRQTILSRDDPPRPQFRAVIDEAALHRIIGGPAVMRLQLEHIIQAAELPNVTIQVLPYSVGAHPALDSTFMMLEFVDPVPTVVYVEGLLGQFYLERPNEVTRYEQVFKQLQKISCSSQESVNLIKKVANAYKGS